MVQTCVLNEIQRCPYCHQCQYHIYMYSTKTACGVHTYESCMFAQAIGVPDAIPTLARIANEMIIQTNCSALQPLFHDLYPAMFSSPQSLDLNITQLSTIPAEAPRLAQCALKGT